jgi:hypothetical protein
VAVAVFQDDDVGYRTWLYAHMGDGYVVNALRGSNPGEPMLHRASCETIAPAAGAKWTEGDSIKVCSTRRFELDSWARELDRRLRFCEFCSP